MANQERAAFFAALTNALKSFFFASERAAAPVLKPFGPHSEPALVDEEDLDVLKRKLERIRATLRDAEKLAVADASIKLWLRELRDLECSAEDILEAIEFESVRSTRLDDFKAELLHAATGKRKREASRLFSSSPLRGLSLRIRKMKDLYHEIASDRKALRLPDDCPARPTAAPARQPSSSLASGAFHGREEDFFNVLEWVLCEDSSNGRAYSVVHIVGMAGVGKTTLVQHVLNDEKVRSHFDFPPIWICASQVFDVVGMTKTMIQACGGDTSDWTELSLLQELLADLLAGKKFVLVLDEVWSEETEAWERLQLPLNRAAKGSKVIVTSRNRNVAKVMGFDRTYQLNCLSDHLCWSICRQRAFDGRRPDSMQIDKDVIKKCKGLPLAAKVIGALLGQAIDERRLNNFVSQSDSSDIDDLVDEILPVLRLSYDHLPFHLKRCFAYCSLFPKDHIFEKEQVVRLWMGQGFLEPKGQLQLEDIGGKYFDDLVERYLFQELPRRELGDGSYVMHDLLHELAQSVADNECSRVEDRKLCMIDKKARHCSLVLRCSHSEEMIRWESFDGQDVRTFLVIVRMEDQRELDHLHIKNLYIEVPNDRFSLMQCLRVLDLSHTSIKELPMSVGNLIHLRYLGLKNSKVERLPESICGLFNLQTLDLEDCRYLTELPEGTKHLFRLRHLALPPNIYVLAGIRLLTSLQTFVGANCRADCGLGELRDLVNLRELHISWLNNAFDEREAERVNLKNKEKLQKLTLQWYNSDNSSPDLNPDCIYNVLERLEPNSNITELVIRNYRGIQFPKWIGESKFFKLTKVSLNECGKCKELPPLGQLPLLQHLTVKLMAEVQTIGHEFCGGGSGHTNSFPMLETLEVRNMYDLVEWNGVEIGDFPRLRNLTISGCCKLRELPCLSSVKYLRIECCEHMHEVPVLSSLQSLELGCHNLKHLPQLSKLSAVETLEVSCCNRLTSMGSLQHSVALRQLKVVNCPILYLLKDDQLPMALQSVCISGCPSLGEWRLRGFEEATNSDQLCRKFVRQARPAGDYQLALAAETEIPLIEIAACTKT